MLGSLLLLGGRKLCSDPDMFIGKRGETDEECAASSSAAIWTGIATTKNQTRVWILGLEDRTEGF